MTHEIKLPCGRVALVDAGTYRRFGKLAWYADWKGTQWGVVCAVSKEGIQKKISLASLVIGPKTGFTIDHKNGNPFDNRRKNLRHATRAQQNANRGPAKGRQYKGVYACGRKWMAKLSRNYLGLFASEAEAARAYNTAAIEPFGVFARLNKVGK